MIYLNIAFLVPAIFSIVQLASIGDRTLNYKTPLIVSVVGSIFQSIMCFFSVNQTTELCFTLLFISQFLNGICGGGSLAFISSCFSHISTAQDKNTTADSTADTAKIEKAKKNRTIRYSVCESSLLLGQFFGSFSSGYIIGNKTNLNNFENAYILSFTVYLAVLIYIIAMFIYLKRKETVHTLSLVGIQEINENSVDLVQHVSDSSINSNSILIEAKDAHQHKYVNKNFLMQNLKKQFYFIMEIWYLLSRKRLNNARFQLLSLLLLYFFGASISLGIVSLQYLYLIKKPIALTQIDYGIFRALNTLFRAISLLIVLPLLKKHLKISDNKLYGLGLLSELLNLVVFAISSWYKYLIWTGK